MNKCRLRKLIDHPAGNLKYRVRRELSITYSSYVDGCMDHLRMAEAHLYLHLDGKNKYGMITDISNCRYNITKLLAYLDSTKGDGDAS
jgi:hypothetical protein